jgi:protein transport protein SEC31
MVADVHSSSNALIAHKQAHAGALKSLDFNPFQGNLLATGASDAEVSR